MIRWQYFNKLPKGKIDKDRKEWDKKSRKGN